MCADVCRDSLTCSICGGRLTAAATLKREGRACTGTPRSENGRMDLTGVDVSWVQEQLTNLVSRTRAVNQSGGNVITARTAPACGRAEAIQLSEQSARYLTACTGTKAVTVHLADGQELSPNGGWI